MLITVGELDYRILASQGMQAFNAAKMHGLEAEMLVFLMKTTGCSNLRMLFSGNAHSSASSTNI